MNITTSNYRVLCHFNRWKYLKSIHKRLSRLKPIFLLIDVAGVRIVCTSELKTKIYPDVSEFEYVNKEWFLFFELSPIWINQQLKIHVRRKQVYLESKIEAKISVPVKQIGMQTNNKFFVYIRAAYMYIVVTMSLKNMCVWFLGGVFLYPWFAENRWRASI